MTDARYRWLASRPDELQAIRNSRPYGPLAVPYVTTGSKRPCRHDHVYVTDSINVEGTRSRSPYNDGSDLGALAIARPYDIRDYGRSSSAIASRIVAPFA